MKDILYIAAALAGREGRRRDVSPPSRSAPSAVGRARVSESGQMCARLRRLRRVGRLREARVDGYRRAELLATVSQTRRRGHRSARAAARSSLVEAWNDRTLAELRARGARGSVHGVEAARVQGLVSRAATARRRCPGVASGQFDEYSAAAGTSARLSDGSNCSPSGTVRRLVLSVGAVEPRRLSARVEAPRLSSIVPTRGRSSRAERIPSADQRIVSGRRGDRRFPRPSDRDRRPDHYDKFDEPALPGPSRQSLFYVARRLAQDTSAPPRAPA